MPSTPQLSLMGAVAACALLVAADARSAPPPDLDAQVRAALNAAGFTGRIQSTLPQRLGRPLKPQLANLGRLLWFDTLGGPGPGRGLRPRAGHRRSLRPIPVPHLSAAERRAPAGLFPQRRLYPAG